MSDWDAIIVGAGPAGLMAAMRASERGRRVLLIEKNRRPGVKILMSGGARCNLTHATGARSVVREFGPAGRFLHSALAAFGPDDVVALVEAEGVPTKVEPGGKVFPASDKAADVLGALLRRLGRTSCAVALREPAVEIARTEGGFRVTTGQRTLSAGSLVLTTGGQSYPGCGTTGEAYGWLAALGHRVVPPRPALVPVVVHEPWVHALRGVTVPDAAVRVVAPAASPDGPRRGGNGVLAERRGSLLFTHFGLSGPVVLDVSRAVSRHSGPATLALDCDFRPGMKAEEFEAWLAEQSRAAGKRQIGGLAGHGLPERLWQALVERAGVPADRRLAECGKEDRRRLTEAVKGLRVRVAGTLGFKKAEVTAGGLALDEIDSRTMQSKLVPGLFVAGELLDVDGPIGGYNFQAAFSTGWLAGESV